MAKPNLKPVRPKIDPEYYKTHECKTYRSVALVYLDKDGNETTNIDEADTDVNGMPIVLRKSRKDFVPARYFGGSRLTFNPKDKTARLRAFEARANMQSMFLPPTIYQERTDVCQFADNSANAFLAQVEEFSKSKNDK